jgi:hypothetical protein
MKGNSYIMMVRQVTIDPHDGKQVAEVVMTLVNNICPNDQFKKFIEVVKRDHRTNQQTFMKLVGMFIIEYAKTEHYDARNEAAVKLCQKIIDKVPPENMSLPLV